MVLYDNFRKSKAPETGRDLIRLTEGKGHSYPLYYFIPTITSDGRYLVYHRFAPGEGVQLHRLSLSDGLDIQLTRGTTPETNWLPWDIEKGPGILDHRSVLDAERNQVIYIDNNDFIRIDLESLEKETLFSLPEDRFPIGQNCITGDGLWYVFIHHDRELHEMIYPPGAGWSENRSLSRGTCLAAYNLETGEKKELLRINSPIHHVIPHKNNQLVFCHPATENGMLLTDTNGGWYTHMRTQDGEGGTVCHFVSTENGIMYEVRKNNQKAGIYDPEKNHRLEYDIPDHFGYTHTGRDPKGRFWFYENSTSEAHDMWYRSKSGKWSKIIGHMPTFGDQGQYTHFHPQLVGDRKYILFTGGDDETKANQIFLLRVDDLTR